MHNAPAVSFPVGRSRIQGWALGAAWVAGAAVCACWASVIDAAGWRYSLALAMPLVTGVLAWFGWQRQIGGSLHWDGICWQLETPPLASTASLMGQVAVHLDFQRFMLLSLRPDNDAVRWLWLDQCADVAHWQAFRRAVHS